MQFNGTPTMERPAYLDRVNASALSGLTGPEAVALLAGFSRVAIEFTDPNGAAAILSPELIRDEISDLMDEHGMRGVRRAVRDFPYLLDDPDDRAWVAFWCDMVRTHMGVDGPDLSAALRARADGVL